MARHDGQFIEVGNPHRGPVAVREVEMGEGEGAGDEGIVLRVVLAFHPERPDPVQVVPV
jgi:hypothetical protein